MHHYWKQTRRELGSSVGKSFRQRCCQKVKFQCSQQTRQPRQLQQFVLWSYLKLFLYVYIIQICLNSAVWHPIGMILIQHYQFDNNMGQRFIIGSDQARYKIILVGDVNVGKTAMFWRYTQGEFLAYKDTQVTTIDFKMKAITINNKLIKLYIWDTAGSEKYRSIVSTYFKGCHGVILVFDLSRQNSFKNAIDTWYQLAKLKTNDSAFCLVGNKSDLDIRVDTEEVKKWSTQHNMPYIETSVKENKNVNEVFDSVARKVYQKQNKVDRTKSFSLSQSKPTKKKCC